MFSPKDEAFDRLSASDPARETTADIPALRAKIDALLVDTGPNSDKTGSQPASAVGIDTYREPSKTRTKAWVAASIAGALVFAAGGFGAGLLTSRAALTPAQVAASAGFAEPGVAQPMAAGSSGLGGNSDASGEMQPMAAQDSGGGGSSTGASADAARSAIDYLWTGRTTFTGSGLATTRGSGEAFAFDARSAVSAEQAAAVARLLGVEGVPVASWGAWVVGPQDGSGPNMSVYGDGAATFWYNNPQNDPYSNNCVMGEIQPLPAQVDGVVAPDTPAIDPGSCKQPPATTVDDVTAATALAEVMRTLGVDPTTFEVEVSPNDYGDATRWVTAYLIVAGQRTDQQWSASVGDAGLTSLNGMLAPVVSLGEYTLISPAEAVDRLNDIRFGSSYPVAVNDAYWARQNEIWDSQQNAAPTAPPVPQPGQPVPWPVSNVTIVAAELRLTQQSTVDGALLLLPTYLLSDAEGNGWSVIAIADESLNFAVG
jgi:hypothetical protein